MGGTIMNAAAKILCARPRLAALACAALITIILCEPAGAQKKNSCLECHSQMEGALGVSADLIKNDIHLARGLACVDCHGGDASQDDLLLAMDKKKGYVGKPGLKEVTGFCGKCHSNADWMKRFNPRLRVDQEREYYSSIHGQRLKNGDTNVATCISCHGSHGIRAVNDSLSPVYFTNVANTCAKCHASADYMKGYKISHDQFSKYKSSVHAKYLFERQDRSSPTCNSCHGNHGAAPPGITSVANVCGQCHTRQSSLFQASPHKARFDALGLGECTECHGNHEVKSPAQFMAANETPICMNCHSQGDKGYQTGEKIWQLLANLSANIERSQTILDRAERAGMEVSRPKFELNEAREGLVQARVLIHSFSTEELEKVINTSLVITAKSHQAGEQALSELNYRRKGLSVSLFFILFLALIIYLKIRSMESSPTQ